MKQLIFILLAGLMLASCGSTRKSTSSSSSSSAVEASSSSKSKSDSSGTSATLNQKTKTTTTTIDTTVNVSGDSLEGVINTKPGPDSTMQEDSLESGAIKIKTRFDPKTGKLHVKATAKPRSVPVQATSTTTETETTASTSTAQKSTENEQARAIKAQHEDEQRTKTVVTKPPWWVALWPWWLIALLLILAWLAWRYRPTVSNFFRRMISGSS